MKVFQMSDEVLVARDRVVKVDRNDTAQLEELSVRSSRRRARLCAHPMPQCAVHEMLIALDGTSYVRPHRHAGKCESFHVIAGTFKVIIFNDDGSIDEVISMGDYRSGRVFYYRLQESAYHTVLLDNGPAIVHETTNGPFEPGQTEFAPWAPSEEDREQAR
ncbi:MAG TPA: WbuC family cupin fold metalloprotein, partial [Pirellulales bacterium]|nr:WbuC family cupin fold metalloprotein [Pirellulales bacterium]